MTTDILHRQGFLVRTRRQAEALREAAAPVIELYEAPLPLEEMVDDGCLTVPGSRQFWASAS